MRTQASSRLRILVYGLNYSPELTGIGKYTGEMVDWLSSRGYELRVICAPPYYPAWRVREGFRGNAYSIEKPQDPASALVYRTPIYVPSTPSGSKRMVHLLSFMLGSVPVMLRQIFWKPDVVWTVEPTFFGAPLALAVARASGAASWLHVQDFEVDAAFELGLLPSRGRVHAFALWLEQHFTHAFGRVSSISQKMVERSVAKGVPEKRAILFPNWVDIKEIRPMPLADVNCFRRELQLEGKIIVLYAGNLGNKQGLELLAPLASSFEQDPRVHFLFCGDGAFRPHLEPMVADRPNVTMLPLQSNGRLNALLNAADMHLLPQRAGAADLVMPSKLTGMLASGRPVIATADAGTQVAMVVGGNPECGIAPCGLVVPTGDPSALCDAIHHLIQFPALREVLGAAARRYAVEHLGREEVLTRFEQDLLALTGRGREAEVKRHAEMTTELVEAVR